jgi:hypothetical protein
MVARKIASLQRGSAASGVENSTYYWTLFIFTHVEATQIDI